MSLIDFGRYGEALAVIRRLQGPSLASFRAVCKCVYGMGQTCVSCHYPHLFTCGSLLRSRSDLLTLAVRYPQTLTPDEIDRFISHLTAMTHRDRAIIWLLKDGAVRIGEALALRIQDIHWAGKRITVHAHAFRLDGAYVEALADGAGAWTGSGNQRVIDMRETRRAGQIVLYGYSVELRKKRTVKHPLHRDGDGQGFTLCAMSTSDSSS